MTEPTLLNLSISSRLANLPPCLIGIEAGMAIHYVARELAALDYDAKPVPPTHAKSFRQGHKNDFRDAHAVAATTRFVPAKTDEATGSAGPAPGPVSPGQRADRSDQPDSCLSSRARHHRPTRTALPSPSTARHPGFCKQPERQLTLTLKQ
jgi:hypothetical protein